MDRSIVGATQMGTRSRRARLSTLPKPNRKVNPTTVPITVTAQTTTDWSAAGCIGAVSSTVAIRRHLHGA
jgi:hypothetical protein